MKKQVLWIALILALAVVGVLASRDRARPALQASLVAQAAPADLNGFARAEGPRPLVFPDDHGPHDDFQTEWWYFTGNLTAESGEQFGYQLTFFRRALAPPADRVARDSTWAAEQVYLAHFALTDVADGKHVAFERLARGAAGLAGAQAAPFRVWLEDWAVSAVGDGSLSDIGAPVHLSATEGDTSLDLTLRNGKPPVLQGDRGYSRKGPEPGNASYYYSLTRLATEGTVAVGGQTYQVQGASWMDHEFSTSALGPEQVGWDWFSLQLDDGTELDGLPVAQHRWPTRRFLQRHTGRSGRFISQAGPGRVHDHPDGSLALTPLRRSLSGRLASGGAGSGAHGHAVSGRSGDAPVFHLLGGQRGGRGHAERRARHRRGLRRADGLRGLDAGAILGG